MPSPFGTGEIVNRLRRLLDLRGKFPMSIDETLVPVVVMGDTGRVPFRASGRKGWGSLVSPAAVNGRWSYIIINNPTPFFAVLDRVRCRVVPTAGQASDVRLTLAIAGTLVGSPQPMFSTENPATQGTTAITDVLSQFPLTIDAALSANDFGQILTTGVLQAPAALTAGELVFEKLELAMPPGSQILLRQENQDSALTVSAEARVFDDHPITRLS